MKEKIKEAFFFINRFDPDAKWFTAAIIIGSILAVVIFSLLIYDITETVKLLLK